MMYVLTEYLCGKVAVFDTEQKAKDFVARINAELFKVVGEGLDESEYDINKCEINPNFEKWYYSD